MFHKGIDKDWELQTLWRGPVIVPWQGVLERLKSFVGRFNQRGVLTKNIIKKLVKKFTTAWMNGLDKTFPNMRCRSLNNCLRHLCAWKCWLPGSQWWWWPPFFPNQLFIFFHFWSTCPVYSSHKMCFCLRNLYLILTGMKKTGVLGKWELSKWDFRA